MAKRTWLTIVLALAVLRATVWMLQRRLQKRAIDPKRERVVILGASSLDGLGAAYLYEYLARGCRSIVIVGRRAEALEAVRAAALKKHPDAEVHVRVADCSSVRDVQDLRAYVEKSACCGIYGTDRRSARRARHAAYCVRCDFRSAAAGRGWRRSARRERELGCDRAAKWHQRCR